MNMHDENAIIYGRFGDGSHTSGERRVACCGGVSRLEFMPHITYMNGGTQ